MCIRDSAWAEQNITTVTEAKEETNLYNKNYFTILRAFGIKNRNPLDKEIQYMNLWLNQYGFTLEIISEACNRTVLATGKTSFSYADSILESWFKKGVHHPSAVSYTHLKFICLIYQISGKQTVKSSFFISNVKSFQTISEKTESRAHKDFCSTSLFEKSSYF